MSNTAKNGLNYLLSQTKSQNGRGKAFKLLITPSQNLRV